MKVVTRHLQYENIIIRPAVRRMFFYSKREPREKGLMVVSAFAAQSLHCKIKT